MRKLTALLSLCAVCAYASGAAADLSDGKVKIGVINDQSGIYSDLSGMGGVLAAQMAIEDFGGKALGQPIELVYADHQNKADIASNIANKWIDEDQVDLISDVPGSSAVLALAEIVKNKQRLMIVSTGATSDFTGKACSPYGIHWTYDTYALAHGTGKVLVEQGGGKVLGSVLAPFPNQDFSSFLLQAQASGAKIIGLANAGGDTINAVKQAAEFGIVEAGQKLAGLLIFITDIHSLGLQVAQGVVLTTGFYWDLDDRTREWSKRFFDKHGAMPSMAQAGVYSSISHYLKAVEAAGTDEPLAVAAKMRELPIDDFFARNATLTEDGRMRHDMYLAQVKAPGDSKHPWDYYTILATIPAAEAFRPLSESECPLVKK